jgi:hypothetical protein
MYFGSATPRGVKLAGLFVIALLSYLALGTASRAQSDVYTRWVNLFNPAKSFDHPATMVVDGNGNTYATGTTCIDSPCAHSESLVIKYDVNGNIVWKGYLAGPAQGSESFANGLKIGLDAQDNVYVLSVLSPNSTGTDIALAKFNSAGVRQWVDFIGRTGTTGVIPGTLAVAPDGNTYTSYGSYNTSTSSDVCNAYLLKRDTTGKQIWSHEVNPTTSDCDSIPFIGVDGAENVYALFSDFFSSQIHNSEIIKYNSAGTQLASFSGNGLGTITAFRVDANGNSYVAGGGAPAPPNGAEDPIVAKFNTSGTQDWYYDFGPAPVSSFVPAPGFVDLALDPAGDVFVAWTRQLAAGGSDISVLKFSSTGTREWTSSYNGRPSSSPGTDQAAAITVNSAGYSYITGASADPSRSCCFDQIVTIKYDPNGATLWVERYSRPGLDTGTPAAIAISGGDLIVTGQTFDGTVSSTTGSAWTTIDYVQDAAKVSPTSLSFGNQALHTQSAAQTVTLKNTAETPLEITGLDVTGDFQVKNGCPATLAAGASCTLAVTFTPSATGARTGTFTVHDNWSGSVSDPQTVELTGTGTS